MPTSTSPLSTGGAGGWLVEFEDEDEVAAAEEEGRLTEAERTIITSTREALASDPQSVVRMTDKAIAQALLQDLQSTGLY